MTPCPVLCDDVRLTVYVDDDGEWQGVYVYDSNEDIHPLLSTHVVRDISKQIDAQLHNALGNRLPASGAAKEGEEG